MMSINDVLWNGVFVVCLEPWGKVDAGRNRSFARRHKGRDATHLSTAARIVKAQ